MANVLEIIIKAKDLTSKTFKKAEAGVKNFTRTTTGHFKVMNKITQGLGNTLKSLLLNPIFAIIAATASLGVAVRKIFTDFSAFDKAVSNAAAVTGAAGEEFQKLRKHIEEVSEALGEKTIFSASQAADAFYYLASAGLNVSKITEEKLKPVLDLAAATQSDLSSTTATTIQVLSAFGLEFDETSRVADVFTKAIGSSQANMEKLSISMSYVAPVAKAAGLSLEETTAMLSKLYDAGLDGSKAGTMLRAVIARLTDSSEETRKALAGVGLTVDDINPKYHSMDEILDTLAKSGMDLALANQVFGREASSAAMILVSQRKSMIDLRKELDKAGGTAEKVADQQINTFSGALAILKSQFEGVSLAIGKKVAPSLVVLFKAIGNKLIPFLSDVYEILSSNLGPALKRLGSVFMKLSGMFEINTKAGSLFKDILTIISWAFGKLIDALAILYDKMSFLQPMWKSMGDAFDWVSGKIHGFAESIRGGTDEIEDTQDTIEDIDDVVMTFSDDVYELGSSFEDSARKSETLRNGLEKLLDLRDKIADLTESISDQERAIARSSLRVDEQREKFKEMMKEAGLSSREITEVMRSLSEGGDLNKETFERLRQVSNKTGTDVVGTYLSMLDALDRYSDSQERLNKQQEALQTTKEEQKGILASLGYGSIEEVEQALTDTYSQTEQFYTDLISLTQTSEEELTNAHVISDQTILQNWLSTKNQIESNPIIKRIIIKKEYEGGGAGEVESYQTGTHYVPKNMLAFLHKGEKVIPAHANKESTPIVITNNYDFSGSSIRSDQDIRNLVTEISKTQRNILTTIK